MQGQKLRMGLVQELQRQFYRTTARTGENEDTGGVQIRLSKAEESMSKCVLPGSGGGANWTAI